MNRIGGKNQVTFLAFSNGGRVEDVTQKYTQDWDAVTHRRKKGKKHFQEIFP